MPVISRRQANRLTMSQNIDSKGDPDTLCPQLARALQNTTILQKGSNDIISNGLELPSALIADDDEDNSRSKNKKKEILKNTVKGGLKRCGGQGDILSGSVGVLLAWGSEWVNGTFE
jgi:ATP-dependent NAD(P)H-hydrate dehydratase